jgi:hypothetical protein
MRSKLTEIRLKLTEIFKSKWVRSIGAGVDEDIREWLQYLKTLGCSVELDGLRPMASAPDIVLHRLRDLNSPPRPSSSVSIWNPTGDGTVIFVPDDLAEKVLVLGDLP